jgi:hypothetical protein
MGAFETGKGMVVWFVLYWEVHLWRRFPARPPVVRRGDAKAIGLLATPADDAGLV